MLLELELEFELELLLEFELELELEFELELLLWFELELLLRLDGRLVVLLLRTARARRVVLRAVLRSTGTVTVTTLGAAALVGAALR